MEKKWNETLTSLQTKVKELLPSDASEEVIKAFGEVGEGLKELDQQYQAQSNEVQELKDSLIDYVKNTSFAPNGKEELNGAPQVISIDDALMESLKEIKH